MKQCSQCKKKKKISEFHKDKWVDGGISYRCKKCNSERAKKWYYKNKYYKNNYSLRYTKENRKRINNKRKIIGWSLQNKQRKIRRKKDFKFRLDMNISCQIRGCLNGKKSGRKWETLVGYTLQDLFQHLEKQFDEKMNWQNYGSYWHIDHIVPQSWFPYQTAEEQAFRDCWGLANLQPLEVKANLSKHNYFMG